MSVRQNPDYFEVATRRLKWASTSLSRLSNVVDAYLATDPCDLRREVSAERNGDVELSYFVSITDQPPHEVSFAIGDVVHNLRATLDNLVWGIGRLRKADGRLSLEFWDSEEQFQKCYAPKISKLPEPISEWIESVQPFNIRGFRLYKTLTNLWNRDKHRTPQLTATVGAVSMDWVGSDDPTVRNPMKQMKFYDVSGQKNDQLIAIAIVPSEDRYELIDS